MALVFPYSLAYFANTMRVLRSTVTPRRFDEASGAGDGRHWTSELAQPLWTGAITLQTMPAVVARAFEAKVDGLDGSRGTFLFADPAYKGPTSAIRAGLGSVTISGIRADRGAISLSGLPEGFVLTPTDRFCISYSSGRVYYGTFLEGGTAGSLGNIADGREIRPYLPFGVPVGATIRLVDPYFKAAIEPGGWTPFNYELPAGEIASGAELRIIQKP